MVSYIERIVEGLYRDPKGIATSLLAKGLISDSVLSQTIELNETKVDKARRLYTTVLQIVKLYPTRYNDFVAIFREHGGVYMDLLELLEIKGMITALSFNMLIRFYLFYIREKCSNN